MRIFAETLTLLLMAAVGWVFLVLAPELDQSIIMALGR